MFTARARGSDQLISHPQLVCSLIGPRFISEHSCERRKKKRERESVLCACICLWGFVVACVALDICHMAPCTDACKRGASWYAGVDQGDALARARPASLWVSGPVCGRAGGRFLKTPSGRDLTGRLDSLIRFSHPVFYSCFVLFRALFPFLFFKLIN